MHSLLQVNENILGRRLREDQSEPVKANNANKAKYSKAQGNAGPISQDKAVKIRHLSRALNPWRGSSHKFAIQENGNLVADADVAQKLSVKQQTKEIDPKTNPKCENNKVPSRGRVLNLPNTEAESVGR